MEVESALEKKVIQLIQISTAKVSSIWNLATESIELFASFLRALAKRSMKWEERVVVESSRGHSTLGMSTQFGLSYIGMVLGDFDTFLGSF